MPGGSRMKGMIQKVSRSIMSDVTRGKVGLLVRRLTEVTKELLRNPMGTVGVTILAAFMLMGAFGEQIAPYDVWVGKYDVRFGDMEIPTALGETFHVDVAEGGHAEVVGSFVERPGWPGPNPASYGLLRVVTEPALPSTIYLDGMWRNSRGLDYLKFPIGEHTISFTDVPGYVTPADVKVILEGYCAETEAVVEFVECGRLNVSTEPELPATIFVNGFPRDVGTLSSYVAPGTYEISFEAVEGYDPPANQTVTVSPGEAVETAGVYTANASAVGPDLASYFTLRVAISPALPATIIVDTNWTTQGSLDGLRLPVPAVNKSHVVQFTDVPGYITPDPIRLTSLDCVPGEVYELEAFFEQMALLEAHVDPDIASTILINGEPRNDRYLYVYVPEGEYYVTFKTIENYAVSPPGYVVHIEVILPFLVFFGASLLAVRGARKSAGVTNGWLAIVVAGASVVVSTGLLVLGLAEVADVMDADIPLEAYIIGLVAVTLALLSAGMFQRVVDRDTKAAILLSLLIPVPVALTLFSDVVPIMMSNIRFAAYVASGILVAVSAALLSRSLKRSILAFSAAGDVRTTTYISLARSIKLMGVLIAAGLILSGVVVFMVQHWTTHWMGTNNFGADILSELLYGAKTSIIVGVISAVIASVLGALVGLYSGYVGGWVDEVIMRCNDIVLSIPWLVLMIIVAAMVGKIDLTGIILIIGLTGWSPTARMVRASVMSIRERQYIERARAIGSADMGIIRRHILPNAFPLVFANTILTVAVSILSEATLSFLGMRPVGTVTWGTMLSYAQEKSAFMIGLSSWIVIPGLCIVLIVLGFSLLGYALDDIMNPKLRKR